jgi:hypothetical protein
MGLFDRLKGISEPVDAEFRIVACSGNSGGAVYENCTMDGVVSGPGIDPVSVHHTSLVTPTAKWPYPGVVLPVIADRQHPDRLKISWGSVPNSRDVARSLAAQEAQRMADTGNQGASSGTAGGTPTTMADLPPQYQSMIGDIVARAQAAGATVTTSFGPDSYDTQVVGAAGRALPGAPGGGLTPAESAATASGGAAAGLQPTTATVIAAHEVPIPAGVAGSAPGGVWDLTLDVSAAPGYSTVLRVSFSSVSKRQQIATMGRTLPVLSDATHHDRIAIDTSRL